MQQYVEILQTQMQLLRTFASIATTQNLLLNCIPVNTFLV